MLSQVLNSIPPEQFLAANVGPRRRKSANWLGQGSVFLPSGVVLGGGRRGCTLFLLHYGVNQRD